MRTATCTKRWALLEAPKWDVRSPALGYAGCHSAILWSPRESPDLTHAGGRETLLFFSQSFTKKAMEGWVLLYVFPPRGPRYGVRRRPHKRLEASGSNVRRDATRGGGRGGVGAGAMRGAAGGRAGFQIRARCRGRPPGVFWGATRYGVWAGSEMFVSLLARFGFLDGF